MTAAGPLGGSGAIGAPKSISRYPIIAARLAPSLDEAAACPKCPHPSSTSGACRRSHSVSTFESTFILSKDQRRCSDLLSVSAIPSGSSDLLFLLYPLLLFGFLLEILLGLLCNTDGESLALEVSQLELLHDVSLGVRKGCLDGLLSWSGAVGRPRPQSLTRETCSDRACETLRLGSLVAERSRLRDYKMKDTPLHL